MKYLVHINPTPGSDLRVVEVIADGISLHEGAVMFNKYEGDSIPNGESSRRVAVFASGVWNYVEPKK